MFRWYLVKLYMHILLYVRGCTHRVSKRRCPKGEYAISGADEKVRVARRMNLGKYLDLVPATVV